MQKASQKHFRERSLFYASNVVSILGQVGNSEYEIPPVYFVSFLNFSMNELGVGNGDGRYMLHYSTCDQQSGEKMPCGPEYYFYCLADFKKKKGPLTVQEKWIYLLQNSKTLREVHEEYVSDKTFGAYFEASNRASFTKAEGAAEKSREVARKMKALGVDYSIIAQGTGLTIEEVGAL